jgi:hypothetical protein
MVTAQAKWLWKEHTSPNGDGEFYAELAGKVFKDV